MRFPKSALAPDYSLSLSAACSVAFLLALVSLGFNYYLSRSKLGLAFISIREDEEAATSLGLNTMKYKIWAFVISSVPSGAAGAIFALNSGFIDVGNSLNVLRSLMPALMVLVGGTGLVLGLVFGVLI
ncbi:MAG: branched-chain amino acid ABC transporter permease, partial [Deltaproteobacteria bacterium]